MVRGKEASDESGTDSGFANSRELAIQTRRTPRRDQAKERTTGSGMMFSGTSGVDSHKEKMQPMVAGQADALGMRDGIVLHVNDISSSGVRVLGGFYTIVFHVEPSNAFYSSTCMGISVIQRFK